MDVPISANRKLTRIPLVSADVSRHMTGLIKEETQYNFNHKAFDQISNQSNKQKLRNFLQKFMDIHIDKALNFRPQLLIGGSIKMKQACNLTWDMYKQLLKFEPKGF